MIIGKGKEKPSIQACHTHVSKTQGGREGGRERYSSVCTRGGVDVNSFVYIASLMPRALSLYLSLSHIPLFFPCCASSFSSDCLNLLSGFSRLSNLGFGFRFLQSVLKVHISFQQTRIRDVNISL
ncbi:hypothetical protein L6452_38569 [Arctium lappa]|uniref:Uncharacterized protein n=1 Tax=Arctium lappa TaxID=4217 RepID=A0ACB8XPI4_ARCLA|nr:hypothetical protein L6452_38569 [Arctium lappa]